ncbi:MAG: hypothetical protein ACE5IO_02660, partial [Thermoplasmata archaeon]
DLHMKDLLEYVRKIDDWYTSTSLQKFIFDSFQRPFPKRVQSKIIRMVDMAFWFSKKREDVEGWNMWYDNMMEYIIDIIFRRKGKWNLRLRGRLFRDVFGVRMLLGLDDRPIPEELLSLLTEGVATFTQEEREEYDLAALVRSVVERGGEVAARLKRVLLGAYEADGSGDDVKEYILSLLQMEPFEGL